MNTMPKINQINSHKVNDENTMKLPTSQELMKSMSKTIYESINVNNLSS